MCLARNAVVIHQDGFLYTNDNIDALLMSRYASKKIRMAKGKLKAMPKRDVQKNIEFEKKLAMLL